MVYGFSGILPLYVVAEYPRSGGTWFGQILAEYLNIPFPRNRKPAFRSCVMHGHYLYSPLIKNIFIVVRDGRDVMVSYYFHSLFINDKFNASRVERTRRALRFEDYHDVKKNLPKFIKYKFTKSIYNRFTWCEFANNWLDKGVTLVKYENLLQDAAREAGRAIENVCGVKADYERLEKAAAKYSFKNQSQRDPGEENRSKFLRKGIAGDWKNYFTKDACEVFDNYAGETLIRLGYEKDKSWINDI